MAHSKQAQKRLRQAEKRRIANKAVRGRMSTEIKRTTAALEAGEVDAARTAIREAMKRIDKAAKKNVIHKNTASRRKSILSRQLHALETSAS